MGGCEEQGTVSTLQHVDADWPTSIWLDGCTRRTMTSSPGFLACSLHLCSYKANCVGVSAFSPHHPHFHHVLFSKVQYMFIFMGLEINYITIKSIMSL